MTEAGVRGVDVPRVTALTGIGPARAEGFARLGIESVRDLLLFKPRRLEEQPECVSTTVARDAVGRRVTVRGHLSSVRFHRSGGRRSLLRARVTDADGAIDFMMFNQPWQRERLAAIAAEGAEVEACGLVVETKSGPALSAPRIGTEDQALPAPGTLDPIYPATAGITQGLVRNALAHAIAEHLELVDEPLSDELRARHDLPALPDAIRDLHRPPDLGGFIAARRRVALEAMLVLQVRLAMRRAHPESGRARVVERPADLDTLFRPFGFAPTEAQRRVTGEIFADLGRRAPMRRLLQGDVGSGKTAVAVAAALAVCAGGGQAALLAPTELLAEQHAAALAAVLGASGADVATPRAVLLTGSMPRAERARAEAELAAGTAAIAVGTHALFSDRVAFRRLDLCVIDEQQRFGVAQRRALVDKGEDVHVLTMTATPIPRTLALTVYGDLEVSLLDESPPGRGAVETMVLAPGERDRVLDALGRRLERGERGYWVTPRIADDDADDAEEDDGQVGAERAHRELKKRFKKHGVELVHGRVAAEERAARVARFRSGDARLLVGTTVVECGVDVPEATVLVVDGADRLGLAQLHQLRGRIGRGPGDSVCVFLAEGDGAERARVLTDTRDGFAVAEEDLRRRGMGELAGLAQAGAWSDAAASAQDPELDPDLLLFARDAVGDPALRERYATR